MIPKKFPHRVEKDSVSVTIYREKRGKYVTYRIRWWQGGEKREESRNDFGAAEARATEIVRLLSEGREKLTDMTAIQREIFLELETKIKPTGLSLSQVVDQFMERWEPEVKDETVTKAYEQYRTDKANASVRHQDDIRSRIGQFSAKFGKRLLSTLKQTEVLSWIEARSTNARTRNNYLNGLKAFLNHCQKKRFLSRKVPHLLKDVEIYKAKVAHRDLLMSAADLKTLILAVMKRDDSHELLLAIGLQAWGGARAAEFGRLKWENVLFDDGKVVSISINSDQAKTEQRRTLLINDSLRSVLEYVEKKESGPLTPYKSSQRILQKMARKLEIKWKSNQFRHGFITHYLTITQSIEKVVHVAGTSAKMIHSQYKELSTPSEAKAWFGVADILKQKNWAKKKIQEIKTKDEREFEPADFTSIKRHLKALPEE